MSALEIRGLKDGLLKNSDNVNFAESQVAYFSAVSSPDETDPYYGDRFGLCENSHTASQIYNKGGTALMAASTMARGIGPYAESHSSSLPINEENSTKTLNESLRYKSDYQVVECININEADTNAIKQAIMDYGAVTVSYFDDDNGIKCYYFEYEGKDYFTGYGDAYYNPKRFTNKYGDMITNHAVNIIGWDDSYSKTNFEGEYGQPPEDGAWLCRNSWGDVFEDDGYFYISYYEPELTDIYTVKAVPKDTYSKVYGYDGACSFSFGRKSGYTCANVFTAESSDYITASAFYTIDENVKYTLKIYTDIEDPSDPESGVLKSQQSGTIAQGGYHTIDLDTPVYMTKGTKFSVVLTSSDTKWFVDSCNSEPERSFMYNTSYGKNIWEDTYYCTESLSCKYHPSEKEINYNVCVRALTGTPAHPISDVVKIDSAHFPDSKFRQYVLNNFDTDSSGGLSQAEIDTVTTINIAGTSSAKGGYTDLTGIEYFKNLTDLICRYNSITALDVSGNTALTTLKCDYNELTYLITGNNSKLKTLWCDNNHLTSLDLSGNTGITSFYGSSNSYSIGALSHSFNLSSLPGNFDVSKASSWQGAVCNNSTKTLSSFTSTTIKYSYDCGSGRTVTFTLTADSLPVYDVVKIDSAHFPDSTFRQYVQNNFDKDSSGGLSQAEIDAATKIQVYGASKENPGSITSLKGIEYLTAVTYIDCDFNQITSLDLSRNTALTTLWCRYNKLTSLDLSNNTALTYLYTDGNSYSVGNITGTYSLSSLPDGFDVNKTSNWSGAVCDKTSNTLSSFTSKTVTYTYDCGNSKTAEFTLAADSIPDYDVVKIDSAHFPDSTFRQYVKDEFDTDSSGGLSQAEINDATSVYVSAENDEAPGSITSLKGIEYLTELTYLNCRYNQITNLDLSANTKLTQLSCDVNQLSSLDVSQNTQLKFLSCASNQLTALDIKNNTALTRLYCEYNQLTSLDVSKNTQLETLYCISNQLTSLDLSKNTALTSENVYCSLNIYNIGEVKGSYSLSNIPGFEPSKASNWSGAVYDSSAGVIKDLTGNTVSYDYNCGNGIIKTFNLEVSAYTPDHVAEIDSAHFPDSAFRQYVKDNFDTDGNGKLSEAEAKSVTLISVSSKNISSLTGIEYFPDLNYLYCTNNSITSLDMSGNTKIQYIFCENNKISNINVTGCTDLITLSCFNNEISAIDIQNNINLQYLWCQINSISELSLSKHTQLMELDCTFNKLTSLDVSKNTKLKKLFAGNNNLTGIDISNLTALESFACSGNTYYIGEVSDSFSLSALKGFEPAKASDWKGAVYDSSSNSLKRFTSNTITYNYNCGNGRSISFTLLAEGASSFAITEQPVSTTVTEGLEFIMCIKAEGEDLKYQWQKLSGSSWLNINGATSSVLTQTDMTYDKNGTKYRCIVTCGDDSVTSEEAVITVVTAENVTIDMVNCMPEDHLIRFVNAFTARYDKEGKDTLILNEAQLRAIELVLATDHT